MQRDLNKKTTFEIVLRGRMEKQDSTPLQWKVTVTAWLFAMGGAVSVAHAAAYPVLNFQPAPALNSPTVYAGCMPGVSYDPSTCVRGSAKIDPDTTPFLAEMVTFSGVNFYHVLIGDPTSSFSQEYYISVGGGAWPNGFPTTASAGTFNGGLDAAPTGYTFVDPLAASALSGNGTGNPIRVIFNQTVNGTDFSQQVTKATFVNKPTITQSVSDSEMSSNFSLDMSKLTYSGAAALTTAGTVTNTLVVTDSKTGAIMTNFDINSSTSVQNSNITGGQYTYANGSGTAGSAGTYTYATGSYNVTTTNWAAFWDPTVNIPNY